jgi:hypothetical protein
MRRVARTLSVGLAALVLAGCWNGGNSNVRLGDVSLGQQLLDLDAAREAGVIDGAEFERLKAAMIELALACPDDGGAAGD